MIKKESTRSFDPNGPGIKGNLFGLPFTVHNAQLVIVPVPWEVTVSHHAGTANAPQAILNASLQIDHGNKNIPDAWKAGVTMLPVSASIIEENTRLRNLALLNIEAAETGKKVNDDDPVLIKVNEACENLNIYIKSVTQKLLRSGKMVAILGGDHSTPLGFIRALNEEYTSFGILQIDAHADLRKAYEGFTYSHGSIMYNALKIPAVEKLVQVGIRDYCDEELKVIKNTKGKVVTFFDDDIKSNLYKGKTWDAICDQILAALPHLVYVSFDIDGLDPKLCPNTGTPVAGGLEFDQVVHLLKKIISSGKKIIGFDLCEVAPAADNDWDANVGARVLHKLCTLLTHQPA